MTHPSQEAIEAAARAAYTKTMEKAPKYYNDEDLARYVPWEEISQGWRDDYMETHRAALTAALPFLAEAEIARLTAIRDECMGLITRQEREILQIKCDNRLAISARHYANDMLDKARAFIERGWGDEDAMIERIDAALNGPPAPAVEDQQPLEPNAEASRLLMQCADFFAATLATADLRAWKALLTYLPAPDPAAVLRAKTIDECEAIARDRVERGITTEADERAEEIADAIAAIKGKP